MLTPQVHTLDLNFQSQPGTIAVYLIPHAQGGILVETGPGSTIPALVEALAGHNLRPGDISDVFLTHIHLDHAGAAGWLARQGARVHVHPRGAPHMLDPQRLIASASMIYGDRMQTLWGDFLAVPEDRLSVLQDEQVVDVNGLTIQAIDSPGHAKHQYAYLVEDICFSGDIGGIRLGGQPYISLPTPPPDLNLEQWRTSIQRLQARQPARIAPTHFGVYPDAPWHLQTVAQMLADLNAWIEQVMPTGPTIEDLQQMYLAFERQRAIHSGLDASAVEAQQVANPPSTSADGIYRYWHKYRLPNG